MAEGARDANERASAGRRARGAALFALVLAPMVVVAVVRTSPEMDAIWQNHPAHFWLVLLAAAIAIGMGLTVADAAKRRRDGRLTLISLGFIASAGFLGLHALATPGVMVGPNAGFEMATPVGLLLGGGLMALSTRNQSPKLFAFVVRRSRMLHLTLAGLMAAWAAASLLEIAPLDEPIAMADLQGIQIAFAVAGVATYATAALGYWRLYRARGTRLLLAVAIAFTLMAQSMVVIAVAANWRVSWWEWHVLMLVGLALIAAAARGEWHQERFSAMSLDETLGGAHDVTVLFADLEGYTSFSERTSAPEVAEMLNSYFGPIVPILERLGGTVHQLIGDALMVVFNMHDDQPDHALLAARAGLALQIEADKVMEANLAWPGFRVGMNSGEAAVGMLGGQSGHRQHSVIGDTVNLAARLEGEATVGEVVIGQGTFERLGVGARVTAMPKLSVKGKREPVNAYVLHGLDDVGSE